MALHSILSYLHLFLLSLFGSGCFLSWFHLYGNHVFHKKCLKKWTTNFNTTCPLCRAQIVPKQDVKTIEEQAFIIPTKYIYRYYI